MFCCCYFLHLTLWLTLLFHCPFQFILSLTFCVCFPVYQIAASANGWQLYYEFTSLSLLFLLLPTVYCLLSTYPSIHPTIRMLLPLGGCHLRLLIFVVFGSVQVCSSFLKFINSISISRSFCTFLCSSTAFFVCCLLLFYAFHFPQGFPFGQQSHFLVLMFPIPIALVLLPVGRPRFFALLSCSLL